MRASKQASKQAGKQAIWQESKQALRRHSVGATPWRGLLFLMELRINCHNVCHNLHTYKVLLVQFQNIHMYIHYRIQYSNPLQEIPLLFSVELQNMHT